MQQILTGNLAPGERLPAERELATKYDTNRNTLREALRMLETVKLVVVRHGQGATVVDFRKEGTIELLGHFIQNTTNHQERLRAFVDLLMARRQLIEMAVKVAAVRAEEVDIQALDLLMEQQIAAFERSDRSRLAELDVTFISALVDASHSLTIRWIANTLLNIYNSFLEPARALWVLEPSFPRYLEALRYSIAAGDATRAAEATGAYYGKVDNQIIRTLQTAVADTSPLRSHEK
jgi:DNA-binding FadR family transcriptional regulator